MTNDTNLSALAATNLTDIFLKDAVNDNNLRKFAKSKSKVEL